MPRSRRPYLIRAIFDWACDDGQTPHVIVAADYDGCEVPREFVGDDGRITLNISTSATSGLSLDGDAIEFTARFSGRPFRCRIPWGAVLAIFGRESGEGVVFGEVEPPSTGEPPPPEDPTPDARPKGSHLRVVK